MYPWASKRQQDVAPFSGPSLALILAPLAPPPSSDFCSWKMKKCSADHGSIHKAAWYNVVLILNRTYHFTK
eukprot:scaffold3249_cov89-Skeletonema_dohrnii-CCMP3373.AAC.2